MRNPWEIPLKDISGTIKGCMTQDMTFNKLSFQAQYRTSHALPHKDKDIHFPIQDQKTDLKNYFKI